MNQNVHDVPVVVIIQPVIDNVGADQGAQSVSVRLIVQMEVDNSSDTMVHFIFKEMVIMSAEDTTSTHSEEVITWELELETHWEYENEGDDTMVTETVQRSDRYSPSTAFDMELRKGRGPKMNKINIVLECPWYGKPFIYEISQATHLTTF